MDPEQLADRFTYHAPVGDQALRYDILRLQAKDFALLINDQCPESREKSLALTKLQEVVMWANASMTLNTPEGK